MYEILHQKIMLSVFKIRRTLGSISDQSLFMAGGGSEELT